MFSLKSQAFEYGGQIPARYAEKNVLSPPLIWENTPEGTKSFALAMTDPDLPPEFQFPRVFAHWMIYNIPASATSLVEGISPGGNLPSDQSQKVFFLELVSCVPLFFKIEKRVTFNRSNTYTLQRVLFSKPSKTDFLIVHLFTEYSFFRESLSLFLYL